MERICKNCRLFNPDDSSCSVKLVNGTDVIRDLPVNANDSCVWEDMGLADFIQEVRFWVEDPETGKKTDGNGLVKIQYPEGFFGYSEREREERDRLFEKEVEDYMAGAQRPWRRTMLDSFKKKPAQTDGTP
jgi:hypothetical protein